MPILTRETELFPENLFDLEGVGEIAELRWTAVYTLSRYEKEFMRRLQARNVAFYGPTVAKRNKSPGGRVRTSYVPVFANYVFICGDESARHAALTTNCVSRCIDVPDGVELTRDLRQLYRLIDVGSPLTLEARLQPGTRVRVKSGMLHGQEGTILTRHGETRLLVAVNFLQQGASVLLEDCDVEPVM